MYTKRELQNAIRDCENAPASYQNIEKLAHLYTVYNQFFEPVVAKEEVVEVIGNYGDSDFFKAIDGKSAAFVWSIMNEVMEALSVFNPRLYENAMQRLKG